ncbi:YegP family protein [Aureisphaera galaxeae]|uniref:YegP family protein n=1 Tax=Aureisphaera galaxeae TaxID=1538023 RepID=UPI0023504FB0|nr:YegP family protein [Aureisphaera galaxeae]MDC8002732.1 YegP family protein [Aureisphaera galaxeae]
MGKPKFTIQKSKNDKYFFFNLKAGNGEIIATSEMYNSKQACEKGIESVRKNAPIAEEEDNT